MERVRVGIQITRACSAACRHCGTSSTARSGGTFSAEFLFEVIRQIQEVNTAVEVGFTGGEPLEVQQLLCEGIRYLRELRVAYGVTTNGSWAMDARRRSEVLDLLYDCASLGFSLDVFHARAIHPSAVVRALKEAVARGIKAGIQYTLTSAEHPRDVLESLGVAGTAYEPLIRFNGLMAVGRAASLRPHTLFPQYPIDMPCQTASLPIIQASGDVFACCGESLLLPTSSPLWLGNVKSTRLRELLRERSHNAVLRALRTIGPIRLAHESTTARADLTFEALSRSPCGACRLLFKDDRTTAAAREVIAKHDGRARALLALYYGEISDE